MVWGEDHRGKVPFGQSSQGYIPETGFMTVDHLAEVCSSGFSTVKSPLFHTLGKEPPCATAS